MNRCQAGSASGGDGLHVERPVAGEGCPIPCRQSTPSGQERVEARQLARAQGRHHVGQPVVVAELDHGVGPVAPRRQLRPDPVVAEPPEERGPVPVVGQDGPALAGGEDLGGVEGKDGEIGEGPDGPPGTRRAERMGGVGDDRDRAAGGGVGDGPQRGVVGRLAGVVDRGERPGGGRQGSRDCRRGRAGATLGRRRRTAARPPRRGRRWPWPRTSSAWSAPRPRGRGRATPWPRGGRRCRC